MKWTIPLGALLLVTTLPALAGSKEPISSYQQLSTVPATATQAGAVSLGTSSMQAAPGNDARFPASVGTPGSPAIVMRAGSGSSDAAATANAVTTALGAAPVLVTGGALTGALTYGPAPQFGQYGGITVPQNGTTLLGMVQHATTTQYGYATPMINMERIDNTTSTATTSDWGNDRLSPMLLMTEIVGPGSVNNPNPLAIQVENDNPAVTDASGFSLRPMTGASILMQCNPGGTTAPCQDMFALNLVLSQPSGANPKDMVGIETDMLNRFTPATLPGISGPLNYTAYWAQGGGHDSSGNPILSGAAFFAGAVAAGNGWNVGFFGNAGFQWAAYFNNTLNRADAQGMFLRTAYGGAASAVADFGTTVTAGDGTKTDTSLLKITGDGVVNIGSTNGAGTNFKSGVNFGGLQTSSPAAAKGTVCADANANLYIKTTSGACL